ncbi:hypothetical protein BOX15_Mlig033701g2, partial [Macrostomum lignano]
PLVTKGCATELVTKQMIGQNSCDNDRANATCTYGCLQSYCNYITPCPDWAPNCIRDRGAHLLRLTNNLKFSSALSTACTTLLSASDLVSRFESTLNISRHLRDIFGGTGTSACNDSLTFRSRVSLKRSGLEMSANVDLVVLFQVKLPGGCYRKVLNQLSSPDFARNATFVLSTVVKTLITPVCGSSASSVEMGAPALHCPAWYRPSKDGPPCKDPMLDTPGNVFANSSQLSINGTQVRQGDDLIPLMSTMDLTRGMLVGESGNYTGRFVFNRAIRLLNFNLLYSSDFATIRMRNLSCLTASGFQQFNTSLVEKKRNDALSYNLTGKLCAGLMGVLEVRLPKDKSGAFQMTLIGRPSDETIPLPSMNGQLSITFQGYFNASSINATCLNETVHAFSVSAVNRFATLISGVVAGTRISIRTNVSSNVFKVDIMPATESCSDRAKIFAAVNTPTTISLLQTVLNEVKTSKQCARTDNYQVSSIAMPVVSVRCIDGETETGKFCCMSAPPVVPTPTTTIKVNTTEAPTTAPMPGTEAPPPAINDTLAGAVDLQAAEGTDPSGAPLTGLSGAVLSTGLTLSKTGDYVVTLRFIKIQRFLELTLYSSVVQSVVSVSKSNDGSTFSDLNLTATADGKGVTKVSMATLAAAQGLALKITFKVTAAGSVRIALQSVDAAFYSGVSTVSSGQVLLVSTHRFAWKSDASCDINNLVSQLNASWLPSLGCSASKVRIYLSFNPTTKRGELRIAYYLSASSAASCIDQMVRIVTNTSALFKNLPSASCFDSVATTSLASSCGSASLTGALASFCCSQFLCPQPVVYKPLEPQPSPGSVTFSYVGEFSSTTASSSCLNATIQTFGRNASVQLAALLPSLLVRVGAITHFSGNSFRFNFTPIAVSCNATARFDAAFNTSEAADVVQRAFDQVKASIACAVSNNFEVKNVQLPEITKSCPSGTASSEDSYCCSPTKSRKRRDTPSPRPSSLSSTLAQFNIEISSNEESARLARLQKAFSTSTWVTVSAINTSSALLLSTEGQWTTAPPTCDDIAPPKFGYCPALLQLELGPAVIPPESLTKPNVMDNSGQMPTVEVQPSSLSRFNPLTSSVMVNYTATDAAGNKGNCSIQVQLVDRTPPKVTCPPSEVYQYVSTVTENVTAELPNITYSDFSGIALAEYRGVKPKDTVRFGANYLVQFVVMDNAKNNASCHFIFLVRSRFCNSQTIPVRNSTTYKSVCSSTTNRTDCNVSCPAGQLSALTGTDKIGVTCTGNSSWEYMNNKVYYVPECSPVFGYLALDFNATYRPASSKCGDAEKESFSFDLSVLKDISCGFTNVMTFGLKIVNLKKESIDFSLFLKFNSSSVDFGSMSNCLSSAARRIGALNLKINSTVASCNTTSGPALQRTAMPMYRCPSGSVKVNVSSTVEICLMCPPGSVQKNNSCVICPQNYYQDKSGKASMCEKCPNGTGTYRNGSISAAMCRPLCKPGFYSDSGLEPCQPCMQGSYSSSNGSTACMACPTDGDTTPSVGTSNVSMCGALCPAGQFGKANGVNVTDNLCQPCPRNTWQNLTGQVSCNTCPEKLATAAIGADNEGACQTINQCDGSPCLNGGRCINNFTFYTCNCADTGYYGMQCENNFDDCSTDPCQNDGECNDLVGGYSCSCKEGYTGANCERERDICDEESPCVNGKCISGFNSYRCHCAHGYSGVNCTESDDPCTNTSLCSNNLNQGNCTQDKAAPRGYTCACSGDFLLPDCAIRMSPCDLRPCENGGTCSASGTTRSCTCPPGLTGDSCELDIDESKGPNPCQNGGTVVNIFNGYECQCRAPFTGMNCTNQTNNCDSNPCLNGATCVNLEGVDNFTCRCVPGYSGFTCEVRMNPCDANPCVASNTNGPCEWTNGTEYECKCLPGWSGTNCSVASNPCVDFECKNGGTCRYKYDEGGSGTAFCDCATGFSGPRCEENIDDCMSNPCVNGFCADGVNSYTCTCSEGWNGTNCDQLGDACAAMSSNACENNGTCVTTSDGSYMCVNCSAGWTGQNCSELVDNCASKPCLNGGVCTNELNGFNCSCVDDFTGDTCEIAPNYCLSLKCLNGGTCVSSAEYRNASCNCTGTGFNGVRCESNINDCPANSSSNACQNGGTCVDGINSFTCSCTPAFYGDRCEKGGGSATESFDISAVPTGVSRQALSVSVANNGSSTAYERLTLTAYVRPTSQLYAGEMLRLARGSATIFQWNTTGVLFNNTDVGSASASQSASVNTGYWTSLVLTLNNSRLVIYINGSALPVVNLPAAAASINLSGAVLQLGGQDGGFTGDYSQVNLFSNTFTAAEAVILDQIARNCTAARVLSGDLISYRHLGTGALADGYERRNPSVCQTNTCSDSFTGPSCSELRDTEPPRILYCPNYISVISTGNRMTTVIFREPEFADNSGSFVVTKSIVSGTVLAWGEYKAVYTATDPSGNNRICEFSIYVSRYRCEALVMPNDRTFSICASTPYGSYCKLLCRDEGRTRLAPVGGQLLPPFYYCDRTGSWFPPVVQQPYTLPGCEFLGDAPTSRASGNLSAAIDTCDAASRSALIQRMINYFNSLNLCQTCTENDFSVSCVVSVGRRRRRQTGSSASVSYSIPSSGGITTLCSNLKRGSVSYGGTTMTGSCPTITSSCPAGQILSGTSCVLCPAGTYATTVSNECVPCPVGQYTSVSGSSACASCPSGRTTPGVGASDGTMCYLICPAGQFMNETLGSCQSCPNGTYSNTAGMAQCWACPLGTAASSGTSSSSGCRECPAGQQLGADGTCRPCPVGYYRENNPNITSCQACPSGYTTPTEGSDSVAKCSVVLCSPGSYRTGSNTCSQCPLGTFQPTAGQTRCLHCGRGNTTVSTGAVAISQCVRGTVDECASVVWTWFCSPNTVCKDTADFFECPCRKPNFEGEYFNCKCAPNYSGSNCEVYTGGSGLSTGAIVAIAVSCSVVAIAAIIAVAVYCVKKNQGANPSATYTVYNNPYAAEVMSTISKTNSGYQGDVTDQPELRHSMGSSAKRSYMHSDYLQSQF